MRVGKIPESVLKRSIFKNIKVRNKEVISKTTVGGDSAILNSNNESYISVSVDPIVFDLSIPNVSAKVAIAAGINNISTSGAKASAILTSILLPENIEERDIKIIVRSLEDAAAIENISIVGGHTEVTSSVKDPIVAITTIGYVNKEKLVEAGRAKPGDDIICTKWIALEDTAIIANKEEDKLKERFSEGFVNRAMQYDSLLTVSKDVNTIVDCKISSMHDVRSKGIFAALWELAEGAKVGLTVDLMKIPVRQETVEIFEEFGLNPYEAKSSGALLIATPMGNEVVNALNSAGIDATIIGKITDSNDRVVINGDEKRFLEPSK